MAGSKKKWFGLAALGAAIAGIVARIRRRGTSEDTQPPTATPPVDAP
jgi:hypothetical protein